MPKKQRKRPSVPLGELVGIIIEVVQSLDREKAETGTSKPVYHVEPHCDGCTCPLPTPDRDGSCCAVEPVDT